MRNPSPTLRAFTLVELIVVVGIIALILSVSLPSVSRMWEERKSADAQNTITGLLRSARMQALNNTERGLFFFVQGDTQRIAFIEAEPPRLCNDAGEYTGDAGAQAGQPCTNSNTTTDDVTEVEAADRFRIVAGYLFELPPPMRAVPLAVLNSTIWNDEELANEDYTWSGQTQPPGVENHRNFFTLIFSVEGQLRVGKSVYIHDGTTLVNPAAPGTITFLDVIDSNYYQADDGSVEQVDPINGQVQLPAMIFANDNGNNVALNFPSVDGLLVYDDSLFSEYLTTADDPEIDKRGFLVRTAQPFYISRLSGAVIPGPVGESQTQ